MTTVRSRLKTFNCKFNSKTTSRTRYNVSLLKTKGDGTAFHLSLSNRFQQLRDQMEDRETSIEIQWQHIKELARHI
jgi:hypothetical protein